MLNIFSKIVAACCVVFSSFLIFKILFSDKQKYLSIRNLILLVMFICVTVLISNVDYSPLSSIIIYLFMIIIYRVIFKLELSKCILAVGVVLVVYMCADIFVGILVSSIVGADMMRENTYVFIICNILVSLFALTIFNIPVIKKRLISFIKKIENIKIYDKIVFFILIFIVLILILYNISSAAKFSKSYLIDVIVMFIFFGIAFIFINERNNRDKINDEYDRLMEYVGSFENWIEEEQINNHEFKNQLAVIKSMAKSNSKINNYIDSILDSKIDTEDSWFNEIKYLPEGGIKGLLYYKLILTKKENINVCLSIGRNINSFINNIEGIEMKNITRLLGIYIDNAMEAAKNSDNKLLSIEIYTVNSKLYIVISNTYKGKINLLELDKKGYTTKGKGHGRGLYFAKKIVKSSSILESQNSIINDYYVQKLIINKL